jgi:hypothetical protein
MHSADRKPRLLKHGRGRRLFVNRLPKMHAARPAVPRFLQSALQKFPAGWMFVLHPQIEPGGRTLFERAQGQGKGTDEALNPADHSDEQEGVPVEQKSRG